MWQVTLVTYYEIKKGRIRENGAFFYEFKKTAIWLSIIYPKKRVHFMMASRVNAFIFDKGKVN